MNRLRGAILGAGAFLVLVAGVWIYGQILVHRTRAEERAAAREQQLRDSSVWAAALDSARYVADSAALDRAADDRTAAGRLEGDATAAAGVADSLLKRAAAQVADSVAQLIARARAQFATATAKQDSARAKERDRSALFYARWQAADSSAVRWRNLARQWEVQANYWRGRQPSTLEKVLTVASCATLGFAASERRALVAGGAAAVCLLAGT